MNPLETRLRYKFRNSLLLAEALTHPSLAFETERHHFDNQRLEFLGDSVLQLIFTEVLYERFPEQPEGVLTAMRARLVSREGLRIFAQQLELGKYLMLGRGEEMSGGRTKTSSLSDAFEALIGAIYLDSDYTTARRIVLTVAREQLLDAVPSRDLGNPKGELQEILQDYVNASPVYDVLEADGPDHRKSWSVKALWQNLELGSGTGTSKRLAEIAAAEDALAKRVWEQAGFTKKPRPTEVKKPRRNFVNKKLKKPKNF